MLAITDYPAFVVAILLFLAIPGPGNLAIVSSTAQGRVRGGLAATLGIIAGDQILMWCAVAGVAALLKTYPAAFAAVQWLGAAYLAWLGVRMLLAKPGQGAVLRLKPHHFLRQSFLITLLNPKAIVFYMAFFPLFIDPARQPGLATFAAMALLLSSTLLTADPQLVVNVAWYLHDKPVLLWWAGATAQLLLLLELAFVLRLLWLGMAPWRGGPTSAPSSASSTATAPTPPPQ